MRLDLQKIGTLCVALFLGGSVSLCLFFVMIFLIEPERTINNPMHRPYAVTLVAARHKNKTQKTREKSIAMPKLSSSPELAPIRAYVREKVTRKRISTHLANIGRMGFYGAVKGGVLDLNSGPEENHYPRDNRKVLFNQVERKYLHSENEKSLSPERFRLAGGGEIDRIGNTCFEVSGVGGIGGSDTGQTAVEKDLNQDRAMNSLTAHQVPCNKTDSSLARDFLKQLAKRGLIMAPVPVTH